jgi:hypothetical protein
MSYPYFYNFKLAALWGSQGSPLFKCRCRVLARGELNARMVEFQDGAIHIVSGNALRKVK